MNICLPKEKIEEFKKALKNKDIKLSDLVNMETNVRTKLLEKYAGSQAKDVNLLIEQKLILKHRVLGLKNAISKITEQGRYDPTKKSKIAQKIEEYRQMQQERIFNPKENEAFLADLAETQLGTSVTQEEAKTVFDLTKKSTDLKKDFNGEEWTNPESKAEYGASKVVLENYLASLKDENLSVKDSFKGFLQETKETFQQDKLKAVGNIIPKTLQKIMDNATALVGSLDNSFLGRQGLTTLMTHPTRWWNGAKNSLVDFAKTVGGKDMKDALWADIYSDPLYIKGEYQKAGILPKSEEAYPTSLPGKIPVVGRLFKASESAFEGSALRMRMGVYKLLKDLAKKNEVEWNDAQIKDIGTLVNSSTARGKWGKTGEPAFVRLVMWAPKMLKANWDILTAHTGGYGLETSFARKQAATNLFKIIATTAGIMAISNAINPGSAEVDPRSSDFGKIKIGNTRFDFTGGKGSLVALASRMITNSTKSTKDGKIKEFGEGYKPSTRFSTLIDFLSNKANPVARTVIDWAREQNADFEKPTLGSSAKGLLPITVQQTIDLNDSASAVEVLGVILDAFGINSNTYK